jgi:hypothetical protein
MFNNSPFMIKVQPSKGAEEIGKYSTIAKEKHTVQARKEVVSLLPVFQSNLEAYGNHYPPFPRIADGPVHYFMEPLKAESLAKKFVSLQSDRPPTTQKGTINLTVWTPWQKACLFYWY